MNSNILTLTLIVLILLSGCPEAKKGTFETISEISEISALLDENPDAELKVALWGTSVVENHIEELRKDCGEEFEVKKVYRATIKQNKKTLYEIWIDKESLEIVCKIKDPVEKEVEEEDEEEIEEQPSQPTTPSTPSQPSKPSTEKVKCIDSDGGKQFNVSGSIKGAKKSTPDMEMSFIDDCESKEVVLEYFCKDGFIAAESQRCEDNFECKKGACVKKTETVTPPEPTTPTTPDEEEEETDEDEEGPVPCTDSDNGLNHLSKGTVEGARNDRPDQKKSFEDKCDSSTTLTEYYCVEGFVAAAQLDCNAGLQCSNGACVQPTQPTGPEVELVLVDGKGFPADESTQIHDYDVDLIFGGEPECTAAINSNCSNNNNLYAIKVFNDAATFDTDDGYLQATGKAGGFPALNPLKGFKKVVMKNFKNEDFASVEFGGFEKKETSVLKIGRGGANDDTGYLEFTDASNTAHRIPFEIRNLLTTTVPNIGQIFVFDSVSTHYAEAVVGDEYNYIISVGNGDKLNGIPVSVSIGTNPDTVLIASAGGLADDCGTMNSPKKANASDAFASNDAQAIKDVTCIVDGITYYVDGVENGKARLRVGRLTNDPDTVRPYRTYNTGGAIFVAKCAKTCDQKSPVAPLDTSINGRLYLSDGNALEASPVILKGKDGIEVKYVPLVVANYRKAFFMTLAAQEFNLKGGGKLKFLGTSVPAPQTNEDTDLTDSSDFKYYALDDDEFGNIFANGVRFEAIDNDFVTAVFQIDLGEDNSGDYELEVYVDTQDGRLVDVTNPQLSAPDSEVKYLTSTQWTLRSNEADNYQSKAYTDEGALAETDGIIFTLTYPQELTEVVSYVSLGNEVTIKKPMDSVNPTDFGAQTLGYQEFTGLSDDSTKTFKIAGANVSSQVREKLIVTGDVKYNYDKDVEDIQLEIPQYGLTYLVLLGDNVPGSFTKDTDNSIEIPFMGRNWRIHSIDKVSGKVVLKSNEPV